MIYYNAEDDLWYDALIHEWTAQRPIAYMPRDIGSLPIRVEMPIIVTESRLRGKVIYGVDSWSPIDIEGLRAIATGRFGEYIP